ncbi:heme biosynthesis protein HemY [Alishewanella sp. 16-MA]|uniref:Heme biosynthesis protein HemY n=1 Tax=Alishewanella maricola TaxID=2795740 RepID=A0ABS8C4Y5_9ALTE|nr:MULTISPECIES: heme biosynthesis HemY N-terminal domain-containing protein [Gammaproteobacteria]MDP4945296.1 heme biosynthesis protein HemY [Alishewanella sp.]MDP5205711.1 heme biosynthesis protein HemY [Alishewanella sp. SMS9]MCB5227366.1 heme biosynthesis protein HemY [Alishewanella maricola]MCC5452276.1 heme biosynthesis protein HemY [Rheinheimera sp. UJ51]MDP5035148.1 heme biosynthesis protein HemY [Alishewanella sp.]
MSKLLILTAVLILAMLLGPVFINNPGYIKIVAAGYTIEMTLLGLFVAVIAVVLVLKICLILLRKLAYWQQFSLNFFRGRRQRKARESFAIGLQAYARQQWPLASEELQHALLDPQYVNEKRMLASYASFYAGNSEHANELAAALTADESSTTFVQADLMLQQNKPGQACRLLAAHLDAAKTDPALGQLYLQALKQAGQWQTLLQTIPLSLTQQWFGKAEWPLQRYAVYPAALSQLSAQQGFSEESEIWQALPSKERKSAAAMLGLAWAQAQAGQCERAEQRLVQALTLEDLPAAWPYLKQIPLNNSVLKLRKEVQHWLRSSPSNGYIYAVLAYLAEQEGDREQASMAWQKVRQYNPELCR